MTTEDLARELGKLHAILHVAAGHPADEETDAETLRHVLPLRETLRAAAARLRELSEAQSKLLAAMSWLEPPFINAETQAHELRSRASFMLRDRDRALAAQPPGDAG